MKKFLILLSLLFSTFIAIAVLQTKEEVQPIKTSSFEGVIVLAEKGPYFYFSGGFGAYPQDYWTPTKEEILKIEQELVVYLKKNPPKYWPDLWAGLPGHKRQYVGIIVDGKKMVWMNFFSNNFAEKINWRKEQVRVMGGGANFFRITYDLESSKFFNLFINLDE